ncbi:LPXTG-motif cell wall-anchored protein [Microbacterium paludicola]|uniref:LPXTG-motif cell wall-anchored protein n=1 Tax=Microbacterium paludicola TaxID=300019 RepID=A0ABU1I4U6_9MICO|nr:metallophosphoesterase [Microbacterium paludicola]MDR6168911.1 LPXTG-motif cell wall-anchored protein [Microbacterium paludicola]
MVAATDGETTVSRTVTVDNTAPVVTSQIVDGTAYQGPIVIDAEIVDAGSGVASTVARLDGAEIALPHETSSVDLAAGEHRVEITATDQAGNTDSWTATFTTYDEQPSAGALAPAEGAEVPAGDVTLQAKVEDPTGDVLDVSFLEGRRLDLSDGDVSAQSGTVQDARAVDRAEAEQLTTDELRTLAAVDGLSEEITSDRAFPYQSFDVAVTDADAGSDVRSTWSGHADAGATVILYVQRADGSGWDEVDRHVSAADDESFSLDAVVSVDDYAFAASDGAGRVVRMLVQHSEGFAGADRSDRTTPVAPHNAADVARSEYDFTLAWESDTQYYNENTLPGEPYRHQQAIHSYLLDRRDELNLQYLFHTGDIIDDYDVMEQWERADPEYRRLDEAGLPYGVLAGNHDVGHHLEDYSNYGAYFGEDRYAGNPWYGGSFEDNRGHYDLISAGGIDFLMLYTGWLPGDQSIAWMNEVLAQYPDRVAIIAQHEFILTTGGLGAIPQRVMDEVVATNPNVRMVFSGHYHDAFLREDAFDDDGDGVSDRTVYSMLFDYQGLPEGGLGFLRLLHFDNEGRQMLVRTYSPSLDVYNSDEPSLLGPAGAGDYSQQEFALTYDQLRIEPGTRTLGTDAFSAEVLGGTEIATFSDVASGSILSAAWPLAEEGERGWYVRTSDPFGAVDDSRVSLFTVTAVVEPENPGEGSGGGSDPGAGGGAGGGTGGGAGGAPSGGTGEAAPEATGAAAGTGARRDLAATGGEASMTATVAGIALALLAGGALLTAIRRRAHRRGRI